MTIKRKDFQKAAALIHEFQLKLSEDGECAELRDALNLALLHMQKYYRTLRTRLQTQDKTNGNILSASLRGLSPMTPFRDAPDRFQWKWINLDSPKLSGTLPADVSKDVTTLPYIIQAAKNGDNENLMHIIDGDDGAVLELDGLGRTAVMYAAHFGHLDTLQILLENGADVNATAHDGSTAVHRACHDGDHEVLQLLIEFQADITTQDVQGRAPIHWACANKKRRCLSMLLQEGVSTSVRDKEGMSPSMWACRMDHIEHFELLASADNQDVLEEDGFERDNNGRTWMHWSVRRLDSLECLKTILTPESACLRDDEGKTVMHTAAEQGSVPATQVILEIAGKSCLEHRDANNRTPLISATLGGHGELINFLLAEGADLAAVDNSAATAWDYARGRQLHYCTLIIASYIRQRAQEDGQDPNLMMQLNGDTFPPQGINGTMGMGSTFNGTFPSEMGDTANDEDQLGLRQLQINGENDENVIYYGNRPIAPPHPPPGPPTPRTPRGTTSRPGTPSTPRGTARGRPGTPSTPTTPRGYGLKRSPSSSMEPHNDEAMCDASDREVSAGSKRKRITNTEAGPDQEGHMSVMSMDSADMHPHSQTSQHSNNNHDVNAAEPEIANDSQYLEQCGPHGNNNNQDVDSVSIGEMDVSDMGSDERNEEGIDHGRSPTAPVQPPPQAQPRYQLGPPASPRGGGEHYYPSYPPHPPKTPPYPAHSPGTPSHLPEAGELEELLQDLDKSDLDLTPRNLDFDQNPAPVAAEAPSEKPPPSSPIPRHPYDEPQGEAPEGEEEDEEDEGEEQDMGPDEYHYQQPHQNDATPMGEPRNGPLGDEKDEEIADDQQPPSPDKATPTKQATPIKRAPVGPPRFPVYGHVPKPPPTGAFGLPASMHHNQDGRVIPPAHLLPLDLPPHGPPKSPQKRKKKKKRERSSSHGGEGDSLPPTRGYAAPVNPGSPQGSAGPGSAGSRERSPHRTGAAAPTPKPRERSPGGRPPPPPQQRAQSMKPHKRRTSHEDEQSYTLGSHSKVKGQGRGGRSIFGGGSGGGGFPAHTSSHSTRPPHIAVAEPRSKLTRSDAEDNLTCDSDDDDDDDDDRRSEDDQYEEEDEDEEADQVEDARGNSAGSNGSYRAAQQQQRGYSSSGRGRQATTAHQKGLGRGGSPRGSRENQRSGGLQRLRPQDQHSSQPRASARQGRTTVPSINAKPGARHPPSY